MVSWRYRLTRECLIFVCFFLAGIFIFPIFLILIVNPGFLQQGKLLNYYHYMFQIVFFIRIDSNLLLWFWVMFPYLLVQIVRSFLGVIRLLHNKRQQLINDKPGEPRP